MCVHAYLPMMFSTAEPGAEATLDALFDELASRQKSGKEFRGKHRLSGS